MKDINYVINILEKHNISNAEYAKNICTTRQNVQNWLNGNGIPKAFLSPTVKYLTKITNRKVTFDELFTFNVQNNTEDSEISSSAKT